MSDDSRERYLGHTLMTLLTQAVVLALGFATNVALARLLGASGKGVVTIARLFPFFVGMIIALGIDDANVFLLGSRRFRHRNVFSNTLYLTLTVGLVATGLLLIFRGPILAHLLKNLSETDYLVTVLAVPFFLFVRYAMSILQGQSDFAHFNLLSVIRFSSLLLFSLFFILVLKYGVLGGIFGIPCSLAFSAVLALVFLLRIGRPAPLPDMSLFKQSLIYGVKAEPGVLFSFFNRRLDMFIVNFFLTSSAVGYYSVSVALAELLWNVPNAFAVTLFPKVSGYGDTQGNEFTAALARSLLFVMIVSALILALLARWIIRLAFGAEFLASLLSLWILLPGVVGWGMTRILCARFQGKGKPEYGTGLTVISVVLTVVLDLVLIPRYGIEGAAIASTVAYGVSGVLAAALFKHTSGMSLSSFLIVRGSDFRTMGELLGTVCLRRIPLGKFLNSRKNQGKEPPSPPHP
jgi:O-antigen/teichoic acid export membrane protein